MDDKVVVADISEAFAQLSSMEGADKALELARESLDEAMALTDYQDSKAVRLLTIVTFLSALSGVVFGRLVDGYPLHGVIPRDGALSFRGGLVIATYLAFAVFALLSVCGALVTFHAIRVRFRYPRTGRSRAPESFLFFREILGVTPKDWGSAFLAAGDPTKPSETLALSYFKNCVL